MFGYLKRSLSQVFRLLVVFSVSFAVVAEGEEGRQAPSVNIIGSGPLVPQSASQAIPVNFMNLSHVDVEILKVTDAHNLLKRHYLTSNLSSYSLDNLRNSFDSVFADRFQLPEAKLNQSASARLPIPKNLPAGWYIVVIKAPGTFYDIQARHMLLTDLGIQVRAHQSSTAVSVTRLSDGLSQSGIKVELYREQSLLESVETDQSGMVVIPQAVKREDIIVARSKEGTDYALLPLREVPLDLSDYQIGGRSYQDSEAYIYSNRDLVKPGESLPINVLLRNHDGYAITDQPITLAVVNPKSDEVLRERLTPQESGYFFHSLVTSRDWPTGRYTIKVMLDPTSDKAVGELKFQLEEFIPERMDLIIEDDASWIAAGENHRIELEGRYLFGSPAAGNKLKTHLVLNPVRHFSDGPNQAFFVGESFSLSNRYRFLKDQHLSSEGTLSLAIPTPQPNELKSPVEVIANFNLQESSGAAVQRKLTFTTWLDKDIPGILPAAETFSYNSTAEFDVALLSADGQTLKSGEMDVELMYNRGPYYWVYEEGSGWSRHEQERWVSVARQHVTVSEKASRISFPVDWGDYRLITTDRANGVRTVYEFYAGWYRGSRQLQTKPDHLTLNTDKPSYQAGDTATVTLSVPIDGQLLLTMETDQIEWATSQQVSKGDVAIEVALPDNLDRHDIYLTATLTGVQSATPKRYFGIRHLELDRSDRKLGVSLTLPDLVEPLTTLSLPIEVSNIDASQQANTWVTVSVVDKGIINLSRFYPVDPHDYLFSQRRYNADIVDLFSRLYDNRPNPFAQSRFGSDSNDRIDNKNDDLVESKTIILMSEPVLLENGKANIELAIPDYNGEGQFIVTAYNDSQVGQQVKDNNIAAAVVTELSVPRFFVPGDQSTVTVDIFNNSGQEQTFDLQLITSVDLSAQQAVPAQIKLADGEHWSQSVDVSVAKLNKADIASLRIKVSNQAFDVDRSWTVPITPIEPWIVQSKSVQLAANQSYLTSEDLWRGLDVIEGKEGSILVSHTPVLGVAEQARGLLSYPYGCAEQTTSKAWPFLLQHPQLDSFKAQAIKEHSQDNADIEDTRAVIASVVARLATMQKSSGGFSLWNSDGSEYPWLTAYVTEFLLKANEVHPGVVPESMLSRANDRLLSNVRNRVVDNLAHNKDEVVSAKAYAVYLLSQQGKIGFSDLENLALKEFPSKLSLLQVAAAYVKAGAASRAEKLLSTFDAQQRSSAYFYDYGSPLRDAARSVLVLNQISQHPKLRDQAWALQNQLLEQLEDMLAERQWVSTQERGAVLQAAVLSEQESLNSPVKVIVNEKVVEQQGQLTLPLSAAVTISNPTDQPLYTKLMATGYLQLDPTVSNIDSPFNTIKTGTLTRSMHPVSGEEGSDFKVGDRVIMVLKVKLNETIQDALLVDRIPAGFVLENPNLTHTTSAKKMLAKYVLSKPEHLEYRNDRFVVSDELHKGVTYTYAYVLRAEVPGTFSVPPIFLESMYRPEKHLIYWQQPQTVTIQR